MNLFRWGKMFGVLALAMIAGGCGGSSSESTSTAISKAALLKKVNAFCAKNNEELTAAFDPFIEEHRSDDIAFAVEHVIPMRRAQIRLLQQLGPPAEGGKQFEMLVEAMEEGLERGREHPHSLLLADEKYAFSRAFDIGLAFGLEKCWLG